MSTTIEALYIYDEANEPILEHVYSARPPLAKALLLQYLAYPAPRPSLLYLPDASPPTTVYSIFHAPLLILCPSRSDAQPFAVLEFLHRVIDVFEDFLGAPLLPAKIESNYDVVAQLLSEMCDGGIICNTEANALRENVEVSGIIGKLFTQVGLPGSTPALAPSNILSSALKANPNLNSGPAIPWRRTNVRHTSNELYVDILESLSVILAPSGQPISATVAGSIAFTAKISGVPDLLLVLSAPGGTSSSKTTSIARTMHLPVFHPCVRLAWWKEHPGELSFVPPDGRFVLAGYEVDLLPSNAEINKPPSQVDKLFLPASVDMRTGLGAAGSDFEIKLMLNNNFPGTHSSSKPGPSSSRLGVVNPSFSFGGAGGGSTSAPSLEAVVVTVAIPDGVRNVADLRCSRGEASFSQWTRALEWKVPTKDGSTINGTATLTGSIMGPLGSDDSDEDIENGETGSKTNPLLGYYDEDSATASEPYQAPSQATSGAAKTLNPLPSTPSLAQQRKAQANKSLMPTSVSVSFNVRGWLPSGIRVDSLNVDVRRSKGLGEGVRPYKGVKYVTVSRKGVERRLSTGREIYAVLNNATSGRTLKVLPLPANRAVENQTSEDDRLEAQKTPTGLAATTTAQLQYTPAAEFRSLVRTASRLPDPSEPMSYKDGDPKLLREAPRYLQAILDPSDISFPRLSCSTPTHNRYGYLKQTPLSTPPKPKYFFAMDLYTCAPLLPRLLGSIIETIRFLGSPNCVLSIVEGRSHDGTYEILHSLAPKLAALNITYHFTTNDIDPKAGNGVDRVEALALLRNQALHPLSSSPENFSPDTTVLFINDVALCMEDILELIHQRLLQNADMTCAMDWIYGGATFYDVWVSRAMNGDQFFEIPQSGSWEFADNLFWNHPGSKDKWEAKKPFQAFACWNGATAFTAKPIMEQKIRFRTAKRGKGDGEDQECYMGEPTLFCKDMWHEGYGRIAVVPSVNVGYDDEESIKVKQVHGRTGEWVERETEMREEWNRDALIEWESKPPPVVKCVPAYQRPMWVPWDQGLKDRKGNITR